MNATTERSKPSIFKLFKWIGIFFGLLIVGLIITAAVFEKQIGALVIKTLNKQLKTELKVEEATLSLIRQFPKAAVYLNNVEIAGVGGEEEQLLKVESISLKCGILGLLSGNYKFNSISISNGHVFVHSDEKGKVNYDVFKSTEEIEEDTEGGDLNLSIENFDLQNIAIHYVDKKAKQEIQVLAQSANFSGAFMIDNEQNKEKYSIRSYAELYSQQIVLGETVYLQGKKLAYDGSMVMDNANGLYTFDKIKLYLEENEFSVDGSIEQQKKGTQYNLVFGSDNARLHSLVQLLPAQYTALLGDLQSHAKLRFDARVNGLATETVAPIVEVNFGLQEGLLEHPLLEGSMRDVSFEVHFTNGDGRNDKTAKLELKDFKANLNQQPIDVQYLMRGLENPQIDMQVNGKIPLAAIYRMFGEQMTGGSGWINIEQLMLNGKMSEMTSMSRIARVKLKGAINMEEATLTAHGITTTIPQGKLTLANNVLNIADLTIQMPNNQVLLNGNIANALPVLLSDSLNSQHAKLTFKASLQSEKLDLDELLAFSEGNSQEKIDQAPAEEKDSLLTDNNVQRERLTSFLQGSFSTTIATLKYGNVIAENFKGEIAFDNSIMNLKSVTAQAMEGNFELNSRIHFVKEPYVEAFLDCNKIDIRQFLDQLDNFGQEVLTAENLHGTLTSLIKLNVFFDSLGNFKQDELFVVADVNIDNGELVNFKMMESFATFVKMQDLKDIRFTNLKNQFKIEHSKMYMPAMFIQSNAINLVVGGEYSFTHDMDFKIKVNVGQVLANKFKRYNPDNAPIKAKQQGLFNMYARIYGNLYDDYKYKIGPKDTKKALEAQLSQELPAINNTLRAEFAKSGASTASENKLQQLKEPAQWEDIPEYGGGGEVIEEVEYIDGF